MAATIKNSVIRHKDNLRTPCPEGAGVLDPLLPLLSGTCGSVASEEEDMLLEFADSANMPRPLLLDISLHNVIGLQVPKLPKMHNANDTETYQCKASMYIARVKPVCALEHWIVKKTNSKHKLLAWNLLLNASCSFCLQLVASALQRPVLCNVGVICCAA